MPGKTTPNARKKAAETGAAREKTLTLKVSATEAAEILGAARKRGVPVASYVRDAALGAWRTDDAGGGQPVRIERLADAVLILAKSQAALVRQQQEMREQFLNMTYAMESLVRALKP